MLITNYGYYELKLVVPSSSLSGKSSLMAVEALKNADIKVKGMLAIFTYGFDTATQNFKEAGVDLHTLSDYTHLLDQASDTQFITAAQKETLAHWRRDPASWEG